MLWWFSQSFEGCQFLAVYHIQCLFCLEDLGLSVLEDFIGLCLLLLDLLHLHVQFFLLGHGCSLIFLHIHLDYLDFSQKGLHFLSLSVHFFLLDFKVLSEDGD